MVTVPEMLPGGSRDSSNAALAVVACPLSTVTDPAAAEAALSNHSVS